MLRSPYAPRNTAACDAVRIVRHHLPAFLERAEQADAPLPSFVTDELTAFLRCGDFEHGFLRLRCFRCADELRVPFSCKARGICPSCIGRRMCEGAALWVDHLLPPVPYRQCVLSFGSPLCVRLGYDASLLAAVCRFVSRRFMQHLRRRLKHHLDLPTGSHLPTSCVTASSTKTPSSPPHSSLACASAFPPKPSGSNPSLLRRPSRSPPSA